MPVDGSLSGLWWSMLHVSRMGRLQSPLLILPRNAHENRPLTAADRADRVSPRYRAIDASDRHHALGVAPCGTCSSGSVYSSLPSPWLLEAARHRASPPR